MKKIIYLFLAVVAGFISSCNPVDDIFDELEANEAAIIGTTDYTISDDDYATLEQGFGNFSNVDDAKAMIPTILNEEFPFWGEGSTANVTYKLFARASTESNLIVYEVTTEDYDSNPETERFDNFDDEDQIIELLNARYPSPDSRTLVSLTYDFFDGSTNTLNNGFFFNNGEWNFVQGLTDDEYNLVGEGFPNFSSEDEAEAKLPIFLKDKFKFNPKAAGDIVPFMFKLFQTDEDDVDEDGSTDDRTTYSFVKNFIFDGTDFTAYNNVLEQSLQFGFDGTTWVPDNTIAYIFTGDDFVLISTQLAGTYPGPAGSAGNFSNFDRRNGNDNFWSDSMLLEATVIVLNNLNPSAEEGQKYVVSFDIFNGAGGVESLAVIKTGGDWVLQ